MPLFFVAGAHAVDTCVLSAVRSLTLRLPAFDVRAMCSRHLRSLLSLVRACTDGQANRDALEAFMAAAANEGDSDAASNDEDEDARPLTVFEAAADKQAAKFNSEQLAVLKSTALAVHKAYAVAGR